MSQGNAMRGDYNLYAQKAKQKNLLTQKLKPIFKSWCYVRKNYLLLTQEALLYSVANQFC